MNWKRLYAVGQIVAVVGGISIGASGFYSAIAIGICRKLIGLSDGVSLFAIGFPLFMVLLVMFVKYLPGRLHKVGMLSDDPSKFGPWFKS